MAKLKKILEAAFQNKPQINKYEVVEGVKSFGIVGKQLYNHKNVMEIAGQLSKIAEQAHTHVLGETDDWFDQVSVNKNMKSLKGSVVEFQKTAKEAHILNQRLTGLYEDIGHVLNRYYEISEDSGDMDGDGIQEPDDKEYMDNKDKAIKQAMNKESLDQDNEFKYEPNSDKDQLSGTANEGLRNDSGPDKDGNGNSDQLAASDGEEMKEVKRSLKDVGGVVGIPALGQIARKFSKR